MQMKKIGTSLPLAVLDTNIIGENLVLYTISRERHGKFMHVFLEIYGARPKNR